MKTTVNRQGCPNERSTTAEMRDFVTAQMMGQCATVHFPNLMEDGVNNVSEKIL